MLGWLTAPSLKVGSIQEVSMERLLGVTLMLGCKSAGVLAKGNACTCVLELVGAYCSAFALTVRAATVMEV